MSRAGGSPGASGAGGDTLEEAARGGDAVALARLLVSTPSVNPTLEPGGGGEGAVVGRAEAWLRGWGLEVERIEVAEGRENVVARLRGAESGRTLLLNGHTDTVGVEGMTVPPFDGAVVDGQLLGRGACDMKGGVGALLSATAALARRGLPRGELIVALTADEEHASVGMAGLVRDGISADAAVVCEPTGLAVMPAHKGFAWFDVEFRGRAAHGSRPDRGVDAIRHAGLFLAALEPLHRELAGSDPHGLLGRGSFHAGTIEGGTAPSVYPASARLTLEWRTLPGESADEVEARLRARLAGLQAREAGMDARLTRGIVRPGTEVDVGVEPVPGLREALGRAGLPDVVDGMTAWVDAAFLNEAGIPAVCFGPGSIGLAHAADEACPVAEIEACARVLEDFAGRWLER